MDHISTLLPKVLRKRGIKDEADASLIVFAANAWLKIHAGGIATASKCSAGTLFLEVISSVAGQECAGRSEELLEFLRSKYPGTPLEKVRIQRV
jgi:hypothetical protein